MALGREGLHAIVTTRNGPRVGEGAGSSMRRASWGSRPSDAQSEIAQALDMNSTVFTVGHGARPAGDLVATLQAASIERVVDVRRFPGSRSYPQFRGEALARALAEAGIAYTWRGEALGGRRRRGPGPSRHFAWRVAAFQAYAEHMDSPECRSAILELESLARGETLALLCSETLWWRCHRRLLADALVLHGFRVVHLFSRTQQAPHPLNPSMRRGDDGWPVYDLPTR